MKIRRDPLEQNVQGKIIKEMEKLGSYVVKVRAGTKTGIPDILMCYKGKFIALEVKRDEKKEPTELQKLNIRKTQEAGGIAYPVYGLQDWKDNVLPKIMKEIV